MSIPDTLELCVIPVSAQSGRRRGNFDPVVRDRFAAGKKLPRWLDIHRTWHRMGGRSTCTMLYGHIETPAQRVIICVNSALQDETGGFTACSFCFRTANHCARAHKTPSAFEQLRNRRQPHLPG
jgi:2-iminoacetate synthase ThiH